MERVGDRVELHPCTDDWMRGDRFGEVVKVDRNEEGVVWRVHVRLDKSNKVRRFAHDRVLDV